MRSYHDIQFSSPYLLAATHELLHELH
jgi:hypothetical protein